MAIDLETGETGNAWKLFAKAIERRHKRWAIHCALGLQRVEDWKQQNPRRRVSATRFYKLMHGYYADVRL